MILFNKIIYYFIFRYDHLTEVLNKILAERPENIVDFFEEYSRKVKEQRFKPLTDHLEDVYVQPGRFALANKVLPLLNVRRLMNQLILNVPLLHLVVLFHVNLVFAI